MDSDNSEYDYDYEVDSATECKLLESEDEDCLELNSDITLEENVDKIENKDEPRLEGPTEPEPKSSIIPKKNQNKQESRPRKRTQPHKLEFRKPLPRNNNRQTVQARNGKPLPRHMVQPWASGIVPGTQSAMQVQLSSPVWVPTLPYIPVTPPIQTQLCNQTPNKPIYHRYRNQSKNNFKREYNSGENPGGSASFNNYHQSLFFNKNDNPKNNLITYSNQAKNNCKEQYNNIHNRNNPASTDTSSSSNIPQYENKYHELIEEHKKLREHVLNYQEKKRQLLRELKQDPKETVFQRLGLKQNCNNNFYLNPSTVCMVPNQNSNISPKTITVQVRKNKRYVKEEDTPPNIITRTVQNHTFFSEF